MPELFSLAEAIEEWSKIRAIQREMDINGMIPERISQKYSFKCGKKESSIENLKNQTYIVKCYIYI